MGNMGAERFGPMDSGSAREPALPLVEIHGPQAPGEGDESYLRWKAFRPTAASGRRGNDKMGGRRKLDSILFHIIFVDSRRQKTVGWV